MKLVIGFCGELTPFILENSDAECLRAIEIAKKDFYFNRETSTVRDDFIFLMAYPKSKPSLTGKKAKRYYILHDKVILVTDVDCPDEIIPTKELLADEKNCSINEINAVEI